MTRIRRVDSERDLEIQVDEFVTKGYKIQEQSQFTAKVKEKDWGRPPVHVFVFVFTLLASALVVDAAGVSSGAAWVITILANVCYAAFSWFTSEEVVIKVDEDASD